MDRPDVENMQQDYTKDDKSRSQIPNSNIAVEISLSMPDPKHHICKSIAGAQLSA